MYKCENCIHKEICEMLSPNNHNRFLTVGNCSFYEHQNSQLKRIAETIYEKYRGINIAIQEARANIEALHAKQDVLDKQKDFLMDLLQDMGYDHGLYNTKSNKETG